MKHIRRSLLASLASFTAILMLSVAAPTYADTSPQSGWVPESSELVPAKNISSIFDFEHHDCEKGAAFSWGSESHDFSSFCLQNGPYKAIKQSDCNFVVYHGSDPIWASQTSDGSFWFTHNYAHLAMQRDGNIVLYWNRGESDPSGRNPRWWTSTPHRALTTMVMQSDGNLVVYGNGSEVLWSSGTAGR